MIKKSQWREKIVKLLALTLVLGNLSQSVTPLAVKAEEKNEIAMEAVTQQISKEEKHTSSQEETIEKEKWYVLGRPMTEEEKEEQRRISNYYNSMQSVMETEEILLQSAEVIEEEENSTLEEEPDMEAFEMDSITSVSASYSSKDKGYMPPVRTHEKNINKGTAKVTFRGIGDFGGEKTVSFKITQKEVLNHWWEKVLEVLFH